ncbi:MAG: aspartate aminotransferase family protein, partial [archaeon]|nr:aspartate aminotransferase family protein [archaeon]
YLYDTKGNEYLDTVAGIAVNSLGYSHPEWVKTMRDQVSHLVHVSNLFHIEEQAMLAQRLNTVTPDAITRTLFVNSGAEANEGALKTAVRYTKRSRVMSAYNCFHGRTSAALGATAQKKYQETFEPLISNCYDYYTFNDLESVKETMTRDTAALLIEGIQGEGGVIPATMDFMKGVRELCDDNGTLLIADEVQTGVGRTGKWWCMDQFDVVPDIITTAKGLGAGMPIGAVMTTDEIAACMTPGTHGTTFGGNPLVCASGCAVIDIINRSRILDNVNKVSAQWMKELRAIGSDKIVDVRGMGFLMGVEMKDEATAAAVKKHMFDHNILVNVAHGKTIRIIPPLIFSMDQKDVFMANFKEALN